MTMHTLAYAYQRSGSCGMTGLKIDHGFWLPEWLKAQHEPEHC